MTTNESKTPVENVLKMIADVSNHLVRLQMIEPDNLWVLRFEETGLCASPSGLNACGAAYARTFKRQSDAVNIGTVRNGRGDVAVPIYWRLAIKRELLEQTSFLQENVEWLRRLLELDPSGRTPLNQKHVAPDDAQAAVNGAEKLADAVEIK
jgi:hypothetical protein